MGRRDWSNPKHYLDDLLGRFGGWPKRRPRRGGHMLPEPVEPDPKKPRSGGAEAPLEFDN